MAVMTPASPAKPAIRDHLWTAAVVIIAAFAMYDVWGSWAQLGNKSGFAHGTGWTLTVIVEVFWGCALFAWLSAAGPRSRRFAMWSAAVVFVLSLIGQGSSHLTAHTVPPAAVIVFVSVLPVIVLALIAILIHLRHLDRAEAEEARRLALAAQREAESEAEADDERTALRADLETLRETLATMEAERGADRAATAEAEAAVRTELETARAEVAKATAKADTLARKLASISGAKRTPKPTPKKDAVSPSADTPNSPPETGVPEDVDAQGEALAILAAEPGISGAKLGLRVGRTERWGQLFKAGLAAAPTADAGEG